MSRFVEVAKKSEIPDAGVIGVEVEGKRLDRITPRVEARLPDGSRLTAAIPPVSSNGHVICSIRRFRLAAGTMQELVGLGFLSEQAADFLTALKDLLEKPALLLL